MKASGKVAGRGALWQFSVSAIITAVRILASTVLARHLNPTDFGLYGMAFLFYELADRLAMSGMLSGVIAKKEISQSELSTCFFLTFATRIFLGGLLWLLSPIIAQNLHKEGLIPILHIVSILLIISGLGMVPNGLLRKKLQFRTLAIFRLIRSCFESGLAVILAVWTTIGYWALVSGLVVGVIAELTLIVFKAKWKPTIQFDKKSAIFLLRYGISTMSSTVLGYLSHNIDYFLVAKLLGIRTLGLYEFAFRIPHMLSERISSPLGSVFFPSLAAGSRDDEWLRQTYLKAIRYVAWMLLPCFGGLAVTAPLVVKVLWGDIWLEIVPSLRILCLSAALGSFWWAHRAIFLVKDRPDLPVKLGLISFAITTFSIFIGGYWFGMVGVACGMSFSKLMAIVNAKIAMRLTNGKLYEWIRNIRGPFFNTISMMIVVFVLQRLGHSRIGNIGISLTVLIISGIIFYLSTAWIFFNKEILELKGFIKASLSRS